MKYLAAAVLLVAYVLMLTYDAGARITPRCPEDAVLIGNGEFTNGRWTEFKCGPAVDDFVTL